MLDNLSENKTKRKVHTPAVELGRFAAIDIGTVTCRLLIADAFCEGDTDDKATIRISNIAKEYAVTNLGEGVDATRRLKSEAIERVCEVLSGFVRMIEACSDNEHPICRVSVMSTSAARDAQNSSEFVERLAGLGLSLDVIPGSKEAALSFSGATIKQAGVPAMVVDVGGGSAEVAIGIGGGQPMSSKSFDVGCRRVTERFFASDPPSPEEIDSARKWMREQFEQWFSTPQVKECMASDPMMIAVAGTATSAVSIRERMRVYDPERVDGAIVALDELRSITEMLASMPVSARENVVGLDPRRAPVIVAGMVILEEIMLAARRESFMASETDILDGMILDLAKNVK